MSHSRTTMYRSIWLAALTALAVACSAPGGGGGGKAKAEVIIDGAPAEWRMVPGDGDTPGDAGFRRYGVATWMSIRARSELGDLELQGKVIGDASDGMVGDVVVSFYDADGETYARRVDQVPEGGDEERVTWEMLEFDHDAGIGRVRVSFNTAVCFDDYYDDLNSKLRCHLVEGRIDTPIVHNPEMEIFY